MGRKGGISQGHKLSEYVKLNDKPKKRTRKYKKKIGLYSEFNSGYLGPSDRETRYDW